MFENQTFRVGEAILLKAGDLIREAKVPVPDDHTYRVVTLLFNDPELMAAKVLQTTEQCEFVPSGTMGAKTPFRDPFDFQLYPIKARRYAFTLTVSARKPDGSWRDWTHEDSLNVEWPEAMLKNANPTAIPTSLVYDDCILIYRSAKDAGFRMMAAFVPWKNEAPNGKFAFIQILKGYRRYTGKKETVEYTTQDRWTLDGHLPYGGDVRMNEPIGGHFSMKGKDEVNGGMRDTPQAPLEKEFHSVEVLQMFRSYPAFKANKPRSYWYTFGYVEWEWNARTWRRDQAGAWFRDKDGNAMGRSQMGNFVFTDDQPIWSGNSQDRYKMPLVKTAAGTPTDDGKDPRGKDPKEGKKA